MTPLRSVAVAAVLSVLPIEAQAQLRTTVHASGFVNPIAFVQDPTRRGVQYVVEQGGRIRVVQNGAVLPTDFLDLRAAIVSGGEQGLLGMAFPPDAAASGRFFVNFTNPAGDTVVARFVRSTNPLIANPASRFDLRWGGAGSPRVIDQPFSNHNGGHLAFGPDGFLYIGLGDGGSGNDPDHRAQNPAELLGKMLRIDVNVPDGHAGGYQVPADNPFVGTAGTRPEIWSFGLRNPWRYNFDDPARGGTGALLIGDVGQNQWEEVDYEPPATGGRNYGWRNREGRHDNVTSRPPFPLPLVDPIHEYDHNTGHSITGGFVYRGCALGPAFRGRYFFADFAPARVWSLAITVNPSTGEGTASNVVEHTAALGGSAQLGAISAFGLDADGELYAVSYAQGAILKIEAATKTPCTDADFDGDGRTDLTVFRPSTGIWYTQRSSTGTGAFSQWGANGDIPVPGRYDNDGRADAAVFRPSTGIWYVLQSRTNTAAFYQWGLDGDLPVPGDYDGDARTDVAVFRPSTGVWYIVYSATNATAFFQWGINGDVPVPGDYDHDGKTDVAVFRPSNGIWYITYSGTNTTAFYQWGIGGDVPVTGDYDGDGKTDVAVFRPSTGIWYVVFSGTNGTGFFQWGLNGDNPVPGDYDGDGRSDVAVFRPSTGIWYIVNSSTGNSGFHQWGLNGDIPIPKRP